MTWYEIGFTPFQRAPSKPCPSHTEHAWFWCWVTAEGRLKIERKNICFKSDIAFLTLNILSGSLPQCLPPCLNNLWLVSLPAQMRRRTHVFRCKGKDPLKINVPPTPSYHIRRLNITPTPEWGMNDTKRIKKCKEFLSLLYLTYDPLLLLKR